MGFLVLARARDFVGGPAGFLGPPFLEPLRPFPANANIVCVRTFATMIQTF